MDEMLFPGEALELLRQPRYDPDARRRFEALSVVASCYARYAMPLLGVKVLLVVWAVDRLLTLLSRPAAPIAASIRGAIIQSTIPASRKLPSAW